MEATDVINLYEIGRENRLTLVKCISPEWIVKFHSGYELTKKDFEDVAALCEKFGIQLPEEYLKLK